MDEATSALDATSESEVQAALEKVSQDKTVLVIAHRLGTIRRADEILVMQKPDGESGSVVERGSHDQLLQSGTRAYRELLSKSIPGF